MNVRRKHGDGGRRGGKGQLQTLEPILIVMFLGIILGIVLLFWLKIGNAQDATDAGRAVQQEDSALLARITTLPELSCPRSITVDTFCIDKLKADAFSQAMADPKTKLLYAPLLGRTDITLTWLDSTGYTAGTPTIDTKTLVLASADIDRAHVKTTRSYFTVYDPVTQQRLFATVVVERETK